MASREHALQVVLDIGVAPFAFDAAAENFLVGPHAIPLSAANHSDWDIDSGRVETTDDLAKQKVVISRYGYPYVMPGLSIEFLPHTTGIDQILIDAAAVMHAVNHRVIASRIGAAMASKHATEFHPTDSPYYCQIVPGGDGAYFPDMMILTDHSLFPSPIVRPGSEGFQFGIAGYNYNNAHGDDFDGMTLPLLAGLGHIAHVANQSRVK